MLPGEARGTTDNRGLTGCLCLVPQAMITEGEGGGFKTPKGQSFSLAETLGFEATRASVEWLRSLGLFPPKAEVGDEDDEYIPEGDW